MLKENWLDGNEVEMVSVGCSLVVSGDCCQSAGALAFAMEAVDCQTVPPCNRKEVMLAASRARIVTTAWLVRPQLVQRVAKKLYYRWRGGLLSVENKFVSSNEVESDNQSGLLLETAKGSVPQDMRGQNSGSLGSF